MSFKNVVSLFLLPFPLIVICLVAGTFLLWFTARQRAGKILVTVALGILLVCSIGATNRLLLSPLRGYRPLANVADAAGARWIVVLGGGYATFPTVPATLRLEGSTLERLVEGVRLYRMLGGAKLIVSGGPTYDGVPQADVLADAAVSLGVPRGDVVLESTSVDTQDEAKLIKEIVHDDQIILVTSAVHMRRSMGLFRKQGMAPVAAPAGYWPGGSMLPGAANLVRAEHADHEYVGMLWSKLRGTL
jgi:uncharacterized SAM-binding protein YcdF (DUF218 family)